MDRLKKVTLFIGIICILSAVGCSQTKQSGKEMNGEKKAHTSVIHTYHGEIYEDKYGWVRGESPKKPVPNEVIKLLDQESLKTQLYFDSNKKLLDTIYEEIKGRRPSNALSLSNKFDGYILSQEYVDNDKYRTHYIQFNGDASKSILLEESKRAEGHDHYELSTMLVSGNRDFLAWTEDTVGLGNHVLYIQSMKTGKLVHQIDRVDRHFHWSPDSESVFYTKKNKDDASFQARVFNLSTNDDFDIYTEKDPDYFTYVWPLSDKSGLKVTALSWENIEIRIVKYDDEKYTPNVIVSRDSDSDNYLDIVGDYYVLMTDHENPNFEIKRRKKADEKSPWETVYKHSPGSTIKWAGFFKSKVALIERNTGTDKLFSLDPLTKEVYEIPFKDELYGLTRSELLQYSGGDILRIKYQSFLSAPSIYEINLLNGDKTAIFETVIKDFEPEKYHVQREFAASRDGVRIPITLISRKEDIGKTRPLIIYVYGAYGDGIPPEFPSAALSAIDRGYRYAIAHVRGGDEMGANWHHQGRLKNRMNSFNDFIDVNNHLVDKGYAEKGHISALGESGSGQIIGNAINTSPGLFRSVALLVPFVDTVHTLMDDSLAYTIGDWGEFGNPVEDKSFFDLMMSYSPYENIKKQPYPAIFTTAGLKDPAVGYWEPVKWILKIRDNQTNSTPSLIDVRGGGHYSSQKYSVEYDLAKRLTFIISETKVRK